MKTGIHPKYIEDTIITCACGAKFIAGSTTKGVVTDLCSQCHPFYTGKQKMVDSAGQVDKFRKKMEKAKAFKAKNKPEEEVEPEKAEVIAKETAQTEVSEKE